MKTIEHFHKKYVINSLKLSKKKRVNSGIDKMKTLKNIFKKQEKDNSFLKSGFSNFGKI